MRIDPPDTASRTEQRAATPEAPREPRPPAADDVDVAEAARALQGAAVPGFPLQELSIRREDEIGKVVVQVIDSETKEVVRQIPPEEWVQVLKRLQSAKGVLVDEAG